MTVFQRRDGLIISEASDTPVFDAMVDAHNAFLVAQGAMILRRPDPGEDE